jgi:signal transduction histidine kinase
MRSISAVNYLKRFDIPRIPHAPILLGAAFAFLAVTVLVSMALLDHTQRERDRLVQTIDTQGHLDELLASMREMESGQRGYLLTGDPQFLEIYNATRTKILDRVAVIEQAVDGDASQQEGVRRLKPLIQGKLDEMSESLRLYNAGQRDEAVRLVRSGPGLRYMDSILDIVLKIGMETGEQRKLQHDMARRQEQWLLGVNIASVTLILVLAAVSLLVVRRANVTMRRAQQVLKESNAELEANVAARTTELTAANEEIQKFAYIVSHDLRSPLVNIMGFTSELEALKGDLFDQLKSPAHDPINGADADQGSMNGATPSDQLEADFDEALSFIKASITKMDRLINAVLTISREGSRTLQPESIDMNEMFQTIASAVAHQAQEADAEINVAALPTIISDRLAIEQVFSNLVDNALKYLRKDVQGQISVKAKNQGNKVIVEISDNGRGIERRDQVRIFELFRRAGVQDRPGEGMGLAHVRALVRRLGGSITVDSTPGEGSVFRVSLPRTLLSDGKRMSA